MTSNKDPEIRAEAALIIDIILSRRDIPIERRLALVVCYVENLRRASML